MTDYQVYLMIDRRGTRPVLPASGEIRKVNKHLPHHYEVELKSYHFGLETAGKKQRIQPLIITKQVDQISTWLMTVFKSGLELRGLIGFQQGHNFWYEWCGVVRAVTWEGSGVLDRVEEHVKIDCTSMRLVYTPVTATGSPTGRAVEETFKE